MTKTHKDPNETTDRGRLTLNRALAGLGGAVVLFAGGALIYQYDVLGALTGSEAAKVDESAVRTQENERARAEYRDARAARQDDIGVAPAAYPQDREGFFIPNLVDDAPDGPFGDAVRRGNEYFNNTQTAASEYVGNGLNCTNCHLGAGTKPYSAPMYAAVPEYPAYRGKNKRINTMEDRIHGCFTYSMNAQSSPMGEAPSWGSNIYKDIESYFYFMAEGAPLEGNMPERGYPTPPLPEEGWDVVAGEDVYAKNCVVCHGADGGGRKDLNGRWIFPALWGDDSFNWGAGMHRINTAAGFIHANMPLGHGFSLSEKAAWDVAAYINSHERPPDPRQIQQGLTVAETDELYHQNQSFYGDVVRGDLLGDNVLNTDTEQPPRIPGREEQAALQE